MAWWEWGPTARLSALAWGVELGHQGPLRLAFLVHSSPLRSFHCQASGSCFQRPQICHRYLVSLDLVLSWCPVSPVPVSQPACAWLRIIPFAPSLPLSRIVDAIFPAMKIKSPLVHTYSNKKKKGPSILAQMAIVSSRSLADCPQNAAIPKSSRVARKKQALDAAPAHVGTAVLLDHLEVLVVSGALAVTQGPCGRLPLAVIEVATLRGGNDFDVTTPSARHGV